MICTQLSEAGNSPVLAWPAYSPDTSPIKPFWDALDRCRRRRVPVPVNPATSHNHWREVDQHATGHNPQPDMPRRYVALHELNGGHTRYWPPLIKQNMSEWPFIVANLRHTWAKVLLSNQNLTMAHLWDGMDFISKGEVLITWEKWLFCVGRKCFQSLSSSHDKKQKSCVYISVQMSLWFCLSICWILFQFLLK